MATSPPGSQTPPPPPPPPFGTPHARELRRRPSEGHLGGVCAGLAEYFAIDPAIVRIAAVILAFSGPGIPAYILAWIFVPEADDTAPPALTDQGRADRGAQAFGIVLLAVAVSILLGGWWSPARRWLFPLGLIALGAWLVLRRTDRSDAVGPPPGAPYPAAPSTAAPSSPLRPEGAADAPGPEATEAAHAEGSGGPGARVEDGEHVSGEPTAAARAGASDSTTVAEEQAGTASDTTTSMPLAGSSSRTTWALGVGPPAHPGHSGPGIPPTPPAPPWGAGHGPGPQPPRPPLTEEELAARRRRKMVFPGVVGGLLVWTGIAFLTGTTVQTGLAVALCIVGVGFVLGAFVGGSKVLVLPAILLTAALVMSSVLDLPMSGPVGARTWVPETVDQLQHYEVSIGEGTLDLTELEVPDGETVEIRASVGVGHLLVIVPDDVALSIYGEASLGDVTVFGRSDSGWGPSTSRSFDFDRFDEALGLELEVGIGQVEVVSARGDGSSRTGSVGSTTSTTLR